MSHLAMSRFALVSLVSSLALAGCSGQVVSEGDQASADAELGTKPADYAAVLKYAYDAGLSCDQAVIATAIARQESSFQVRALNTGNTDGTWDYGLWQINSGHGYSKAWLAVPENNAAAMYKISNGGRDWTPWVGYQTGAYRPFLSAARSAQARYGCDGAGSGLSTPSTDSSTDTCHSATLAEDIPRQECVQSRSDSQWYQCTDLGWVQLYSDGTGYLGACTKSYALN